jgi:hypothetical protein
MAAEWILRSVSDTRPLQGTPRGGRVDAMAAPEHRSDELRNGTLRAADNKRARNNKSFHLTKPGTASQQRSCTCFLGTKRPEIVVHNLKPRRTGAFLLDCRPFGT